MEMPDLVTRHHVNEKKHLFSFRMIPIEINLFINRLRFYD
jgi:hypothetical protein